jgi:hypothetical protein
MPLDTRSRQAVGKAAVSVRGNARVRLSRPADGIGAGRCSCVAR